MQGGTAPRWEPTRKWLAAEAARLAREAPDERASAALDAALVDGRAAVAVAELDRLAAADPVLREHLCVALAARATEVQSVTREGALVVVDRTQLDACRALAARILELAPRDRRLLDFATELRDRVTAGERWVWTAPASWAPVVAAIVVLLALPVLTALSGERAVVVLGGLLGAAAVAGLVGVHRRQHWAVRGRALAPYVWRRGR